MRRAAGAMLILLASSCSPERDATSTGKVANEIPIGVYAALTGPTATFGQATRDGAQLAADEINAAGGIGGRMIRVVVEDDQGRAEEAASVVTKLITKDKVVAVIGENASSRSLAAAPICESHGVPMISPSSTNPDVTKKGEFIFRVCFIDSWQGAAIARFAWEDLGLKRVAILRDFKNDYSIGLADFFQRSFRERGGTIVADQSYSEGDSDFRSQLTAIRVARPDAIFIPGYYTDVGQIAIQARDLGISARLIGGDGWDSPKLLEIGGSSLDGSYFANHYAVSESRPAVQTFVAKFRGKFQRDPDSVHALSYDAMQLIADAMRRAGSVTDRRAIRDRLAETRDFQGVSGVITMGPDRNPIKPVVILEVVRGKVEFERSITP